MDEGLDESLSGHFTGKKMKQRIQREMVLVLKMAVRWCVYVVIKSLCFFR